ncbi:MAG: hypothetical protein KF815_07615 [Rhodospirillales bacterium]|nr:hypothetical protein [Rhodospirillales bacterium]
MNDLDQAWTVGDLKTELPQARDEIRLSGREGDLGQQPEGTNEGRILPDPENLRFGCLGGRRRDVSSSSTTADHLDDFFPASRSRKRAESDVTHPRLTGI